MTSSMIFFEVTEGLISRFWAKVDRRGPDECWPWTAAKTEDGYGVINAGGANRSMLRATHVALVLAGFPRPGNAHALHSCDNPPCCNDRHLRWGTNFENVQDAKQRGRSAVGRKNGQSKLSDSDVASIRGSASSALALAKQYGVDPSAISCLRRRVTWRHIP